MPEGDRLVMSVSEVRRALGIGRSTGYRLAAKIGIRVGKRVMIPRERFEQLLKDGIELDPEPSR
jgi:hypothetical protein